MKLRVAAPLLLGLLAACGPEAGVGAPGTNPAGRRDVRTAATSRLVPDGYAGRYQADGILVLEDASHGPEMCAYQLDSDPPQCRGPDLVGWSWARVKYSSGDRTRWGHYRITGRFQGTKFTVTEVADPGAPDVTPRPAKRRGDETPCPEPRGGWKPIDPARATDAAMQAASALAQRSPDYAGLWIDQGQFVTEATANDPGKFILNVSFTGDVAGHTARLREVWGGALCVSQVRYTEAQLVSIQKAVTESLPGGASSDIDVYANRVMFRAWAAFERNQKELDARYGAGAVVLTGVLRPIDQ
ncbi:MAG TPA: hypothetical protein VKB80_13715 [Kofleriaceae bacterium]|nr:hypothetical protein [Kofleriaceae bacterium]